MNKKVNLEKLDEEATNRYIKVSNFKTCLFGNKEEYREMNCIRSYKHELYSITINKNDAIVALSPKDEKRYVK